MLRATRLKATAEAALAAAVKLPLELAYVRAEAFKAVKSLPLVGRVETVLGMGPRRRRGW